MKESDWWLAASKRDYLMAQELFLKEFFEGTVFHSQQSAEKALKALIVKNHHFSRTHSCMQLFNILEEIGFLIPNELKTAARKLDLHYIPSRYPNGVGGSPEDFYDKKIAEESIQYSKNINNFVKNQFEETV